MLYKKPYLFLLALVFALLPATAQSLPALTPPGATAGLYTRNLAIKKAFFIDFQTEWNRLGFFDSIKDLAAQDGEVNADDLQLLSEILNVDLVGREGLLVVYPSGDFFALARPSANRVDTLIALLNKSMENPETRNGWKLDRTEEGNTPVYVGHNGELILIGSEGAVERFLSGERGLKLPVEGDLAFWLDAEPLWPLLESPDLGLPPQVVRTLKTFGGFSWSLEIQDGGVFTRSRLPLNPDQDAELARILMPADPAWPLDELPKGVAASSMVFDLAAFGDYATRYAADLGADFQLDLSAFGNRLALVDAGSTDPQEMLQNPIGNLLIVLETRDALTAEVTLLSWIQMLAGFSTPEGTGGFTVEALEIAGMPAKKIGVGMLGTLYLVAGEDRLYLATSERAARLLESPDQLANDAAYRQLAETYLPDQFHGVSYTNNRRSLEQMAQMLPMMMMQTIDDPDAQALVFELTDKYAQFLNFLAERVGSSISYQQVQGNDLVGFGFTEVAW
ncbi:hypothetical protein ACMC9I_04570 [Deinococcota bacterium DY0809b]